jgi:hypothetical protein
MNPTAPTPACIASASAGMPPLMAIFEEDPGAAFSLINHF